MKVINSLIAVEVPRGSRVKISGTNWLCYKNYNESIQWQPVEQLPFPAEIIGLASEIGDFCIRKVLIAASFESLTTNLRSSFQSLTSIHSLTTTPTTDIIFLRKKL